MPVEPFNHGIRTKTTDTTPLVLRAADQSRIGLIVTAPLAGARFPLDERVDVFANDPTLATDLGATGTALDALNAILAQGINAKLAIVRVAEGTGGTAQAILEATISNIVGSAASFTGVHALKEGVADIGIIVAPGMTANRVAAAANPAVVAMLIVAAAMKAIVVADADSASLAAATTWRNDFTNGDRLYAVAQGIKMLPVGASIPVVKASAAYVAGVIAKVDQYGKKFSRGTGPFYSPSNEPILGIVGPSRVVPYVAGEVVHEANSLNAIQLSCIRNTNILWGNRLLASDAKWQFINVRRTWDFIMKTIATNFDIMNDESLGVLFTVAQVQALDQLLDDLKANGAILPGSQAYWERDLNSNQLMRAGGLKISFKAEPAPPVEDIGFTGYRDEMAFDFLAEDIANALRQYGLRAV
jgi:uncharacterized protein